MKKLELNESTVELSISDFLGTTNSYFEIPINSTMSFDKIDRSKLINSIKEAPIQEELRDYKFIDIEADKLLEAFNAEYTRFREGLKRLIFGNLNESLNESLNEWNDLYEDLPEYTYNLEVNIKPNKAHLKLNEFKIKISNVIKIRDFEVFSHVDSLQ